jgi:signal transduction histidine kinase
VSAPVLPERGRRALLIGDALWRANFTRVAAQVGVVSCGAFEVAEATAYFDSVDVVFVNVDDGDPWRGVSSLWWVAPRLPVIFCGDRVDDDLSDAARDAGISVLPALPRPTSVGALVDVVATGILAASADAPATLARAMASLCEIGINGHMLDDLAADVPRYPLDAATAIIAELFRADIVSIMLVDPDGVLRTIANVGLEGVVGLPARAGGLGELVRSTGAARLVIGDGAPLGIDRAATSGKRSVAASMIVPIRGNAETVRGVLTVGKRRRHSVYTPRDLEVCIAVATLLSELFARADADRDAQELERRLVANERLTTLGELAAGVVHDVASPLGAVRANLETLISHLAEIRPLLEAVEQERGLTPVLEDLPSLLCETYEGLFRANDVIRQMRQVVRLGRTGQGEAVDVAAAIESAIRMLRSRVQTPVSFLVEERCFIRGVAVELLQVITNLIANANDACVDRRKAEVDLNPSSDYRPEITVRLRHEGERVVVVVADNGTGMSPEVLARMWEKLFTTKEIGRGTGLGLPIVQRVMNEHGGTVEVSSAEGRGTEFRLLFPREHLTRNEIAALV